MIEHYWYAFWGPEFGIVAAYGVGLAIFFVSIGFGVTTFMKMNEE